MLGVILSAMTLIHLALGQASMAGDGDYYSASQQRQQGGQTGPNNPPQCSVLVSYGANVGDVNQRSPFFAGSMTVLVMAGAPTTTTSSQSVSTPTGATTSEQSVAGTVVIPAEGEGAKTDEAAGIKSTPSGISSEGPLISSSDQQQRDPQSNPSSLQSSPGGGPAAAAAAVKDWVLAWRFTSGE